jgi:preprotein translocase subunit SecE
MRATGIVLIIVGILMMIFTGINFTTEKKVVDVGPLEINKKENKRIGWPTYVGGTVTVLGVVVLVAGRKKA